MYCLHCNTQNAATAYYCEACGDALRPEDRADEPAGGPRHLERHPQFERNWREL